MDFSFFLCVYDVCVYVLMCTHTCIPVQRLEASGKCLPQLESPLLEVRLSSLAGLIIASKHQGILQSPNTVLGRLPLSGFLPGCCDPNQVLMLALCDLAHWAISPALEVDIPILMHEKAFSDHDCWLRENELYCMVHLPLRVNALRPKSQFMQFKASCLGDTSEAYGDESRTGRTLSWLGDPLSIGQQCCLSTLWMVLPAFPSPSLQELLLFTKVKVKALFCIVFIFFWTF